MTTRPEFCKDEHLQYLDDLRESGTTNMFGAGRYLAAEFPDLNDDNSMRSYRSSTKAQAILRYWIESFGERHK